MATEQLQRAEQAAVAAAAAQQPQLASAAAPLAPPHGAMGWQLCWPAMAAASGNLWSSMPMGTVQPASCQPVSFPDAMNMHVQQHRQLQAAAAAQRQHVVAAAAAALPTCLTDGGAGERTRGTGAVGTGDAGAGGKAAAALDRTAQPSSQQAAATHVVPGAAPHSATAAAMAAAAAAAASLPTCGGPFSLGGVTLPGSSSAVFHPGLLSQSAGGWALQTGSVQQHCWPPAPPASAGAVLPLGVGANQSAPAAAAAAAAAAACYGGAAAAAVAGGGFDPALYWRYLAAVLMQPPSGAALAGAHLAFQVRFRLNSTEGVAATARDGHGAGRRFACLLCD